MSDQQKQVESYSRIFNNYWVHSGRTKLQSNRDWDEGSVEDGSYPSARLGRRNIV